ncbi:MAG TPA: lysylphosphatidylglycerol synthase transmembrane domain-containing protein [Ktedonobacterales bacterium]|nr:lysylphosphatidylglycerol synthase transmembrane domain-containing protein [Ktedonobacterales bacterium]
MKQLLQPKVLIPAVLGVAIIVALLSFGNISKVVSAMEGFNRLFVVWIVLIFAGYTAVRGWQWLYLLDRLGMKTTRRGEIFAFLLSEATKSIPIGNYFQNYLLNRSEGADIGRTSAATTAMVLGEVAVSLTGIVVLGLGDWTFYLRIVIIVGLLVFGALCWLFYRLHKRSGPPQWVTRHKWSKKAYEELKQFGEGAKDLLKWRTLVVVYLNSLVYLLMAGGALYFVAHAVGVDLAYGPVLAVYFFGLAVSLIFPLPIDFGVSEVSGTGAFLLVGVAKASAVSIMLIFRILSILSALLFAAVACVVMRDQLREALSSRQSKRQGKQDHQDSGGERASEEGIQTDQSGEREDSEEEERTEGQRQASA